jgi:hypothetical protein
MKDIDPALRIKASLKNGVEAKEGYDAFVIALKDLIETSISENPDDPQRGTYISEYLRDSVDAFNAFVIEDVIKRVIRNYLTEYNVDIDRIDVFPDEINNEYVVSIPVRESDVSEVSRNLKIVLEKYR